MQIIIWAFFAILLRQASCFPGFDFGFSSTNDQVVPDQFLEDLKKLVTDEGLSSKDEDAMKKMLTGLFNPDSNQQPEAKQTNMAENKSSSSPSVSDLTQHPSLGLLKSFSVGQSFLKNSPLVRNQYEGSMVEVKSLAEWVSLDRTNVKNGRPRRQKIPSLEGAIQEFPSPIQEETKEEIPKNQSNESNLDKEPDHLQTPELVHESNGNQVIENDPALKLDQSEIPSISGEHKQEPHDKSTSELSNVSQGNDMPRTGYYASSVGWMKPQTNRKIPPPQEEEEEDEEEDDNSSFVDNIWSKISGFFPSL